MRITRVVAFIAWFVPVFTLWPLSTGRTFITAQTNAWVPVSSPNAVESTQRIHLPLVLDGDPWSIPKAPTLFPIDDCEGDGDYTVQWSREPFADQYELQQSLDGGDWTTVYTGPDVSRDFTNMSCWRCGYRVRAENPRGQSAWSNQEFVGLPAPILERPYLFPIDNSDGDGDYTVRWLAMPSGDQYELQSASGGDWITVYTGTDESRDFTNMPPGVYSYRVRTENCQGQSPWSPQQSVVVPDQPSCAARLGQ